MMKNITYFESVAKACPQTNLVSSVGVAAAHNLGKRQLTK